MKVQCKRFESTTKSWDELVEQAAAFATIKGRDRLINISASALSGKRTLARGWPVVMIRSGLTTRWTPAGSR